MSATRILAPLRSRALLQLSGKDVWTYLQGLTTNSIPALQSQTNRSAHFSAFLNAQGRLLHDIALYPEGEESVYVECDRDEVDNVAKLLKRYKLRAKVNIRKVDEEERSVYALWDHGRNGPLPDGAEGDILSTLPKNSIVDTRAPSFGFRGAWNSENTKAASEVLEVGLSDAETAGRLYRKHRYTWGIPEGQKELISGSALPLEANFDYMGGVDFKKGCYVGQELTIRTKHRGVVRKRILPLVFHEVGGSSLSESTEPVFEEPDEGLVQPEFPEVPNGTDVTVEGKTGRAAAAGKILGSLDNIGLGLCRLEVMTVPGAGDCVAQWEVEGVSKKLGVTAHVPWWHASRAG